MRVGGRVPDQLRMDIRAEDSLSALQTIRRVGCAGRLRRVAAGHPRDEETIGSDSPREAGEGEGGEIETDDGPPARRACKGGVRLHRLQYPDDAVGGEASGAQTVGRANESFRKRLPSLGHLPPAHPPARKKAHPRHRARSSRRSIGRRTSRASAVKPRGVKFFPRLVEKAMEVSKVTLGEMEKGQLQFQYLIVEWIQEFKVTPTELALLFDAVYLAVLLDDSLAHAAPSVDADPFEWTISPKNTPQLRAERLVDELGRYRAGGYQSTFLQKVTSFNDMMLRFWGRRQRGIGYTFAMNPTMALAISAGATEVAAHLAGYPIVTTVLATYFGYAHKDILFWTATSLSVVVFAQASALGIQYVTEEDLNQVEQLRRRVQDILTLVPLRRQYETLSKFLPLVTNAVLQAIPADERDAIMEFVLQNPAVARDLTRYLEPALQPLAQHLAQSRLQAAPEPVLQPLAQQLTQGRLQAAPARGRHRSRSPAQARRPPRNQ